MNTQVIMYLTRSTTQSNIFHDARIYLNGYYSRIVYRQHLKHTAKCITWHKVNITRSLLCMLCI
jgi:hypothetical protein